jgi:predicted NAD/FAD-binding protein
MKIAVVGTGISGLVSAFLLSHGNEVTVFEANDYTGGHTHTIEVPVQDREYRIDTGFIVFNRDNYPNFDRLLDRLRIESQPTSMSFSVRCESTGLEYNGTSLNTLFAQRSNLLRPSFHRMVRDIVRFYREAAGILELEDPDLTLGRYLRDEGYSPEFIEKHIIPMGAAIWSSDARTVEQFPIRFFVEFFANHGFLNLGQRPAWRVIKDGSSRYVERLIEPFQDRIRLSTDVISIRRLPDSVEVVSRGMVQERYDYVVVATHSDEALGLLTDPSVAESEILGSITYQANEVLLHTDGSVLPKRKLARASWNYYLPKQDSGNACVTYYMNLLQGIEAPIDFCVTLNQTAAIEPSRILRKLVYHHPVFSKESLAAQQRWEEINGTNRTFFCGAYWGNGFHEDGVRSALRCCKYFGKGL